MGRVLAKPGTEAGIAVSDGKALLRNPPLASIARRYTATRSFERCHHSASPPASAAQSA